MSVVEGISGFTELDRLNLLTDLRVKGVPVATGGASERANYVLVKTKADFPDPVGGVITLANNVDYEINGFIDLGTDTILLNGSNNIYGINPELDILKTSSISALVAGIDAGIISDNVTFVNDSGVLFNIEDQAATSVNSSFITGCVFANSAGVGTFKNLLVVQIEKCALRSMSNGVVMDGIEGTALRVDGNIVEGNTSGTIIDLGSSVLEVISLDHNFIDTESNPVFISGLTDSGNISTNGQAVVTANTSFGAGTVTSSGISPVDERWLFNQNNTVVDTPFSGGMYMSGNATSTTVTQNVPTKVLGITTASILSRFKMPEDNRIQYVDKKDLVAKIDVSINASKTGIFGSSTYAYFIYKNGAPVPESETRTELSGNDIDSSSMTLVVNLQTDDYLEVWVESLSSNDAVTVQNLQFIVSKL